jgi:hypothetical protein
MDDVPQTIKSSVKFFRSVGYIGFADLVKSTTDYSVIKLDIESNNDDKVLYDQIVLSANDLIKHGHKTRQRFQGNRINDIGNAIEDVFVQELRKTTLSPELLSKSGYPDMKITDQANQVTYLESKAVSTDWNSSFRSFYYLDGKKIASDARHLLIAWDLIEETPKYWQIKGWKLLDLFHLKVKAKLEFNSSNRDLYQKELIIAEM